MLGRFLESLRNLFASMFGTKRDQPQPPAPKPAPAPPRPTPPVNPAPTPSPSVPNPPADPTTAPPADPNDPQDASELQPDTVIIVAHELEKVTIDPNEPDADFDEDVVSVEEEPEPEPEPTPTPPSTPQRQQRYLWCLDNGHGSKTAGKRSPVMADGRQLLEYEFNRDIVARIIERLDKEGVAYYNVVPEVNIDNFLEGRVLRANRKSSRLPKIFVSVHANAGPAASSQSWTADSIRGVETWFYHGSKKGQRIARVFQKHIVDATGFVNRHLKSRPERQFYVLRKTRMPAVLTENGFYNNRHEVQALLRDDVRQKIADAHVAAILEVEENGI